jgi:hypothetical protein
MFFVALSVYGSQKKTPLKQEKEKARRLLGVLDWVLPAL